MPKLSNLIKSINDILKKSNKLYKLTKIQPLSTYTKGKGSGKSRQILRRTYCQLCGYQKTDSPRACSAFTKQKGPIFLECNSNAKHVGSVLYQIQNEIKTCNCLLQLNNA